jgi:hypothetical protein
LDSERDYYQERRKESNARLIQKKGMIGTEVNRIRKEKQRLDCNEAQYEEKE